MAYSLSNIYLVTPIIIIGGLLQGFDISSMSAIASNKIWQKRFGDPNAAAQGGITASISGGSFLGCFVNMLTIDRFGRRTTLQIGSLIFIAGSVLCASSVAVPMLIVGRILCGLAVGMFTSTGPTYLAELAPHEVRGRILSLQQWSITWGGMIMFYITYGCSFTKTEAVFRVPWALQIVPALIMFIGLFFVPRSPRWLAAQDRYDEALQVLADLHAKGDLHAPLVRAEMAEIRESMRISQALGISVRWSEMFNSTNRLRIINGLCVHIWTQLSGNNAVLYYVTYIMEMAGLTGNVNLIASSIQYVVNVVFTLPTILFLDRVGRRPALLFGSTFMMIWLYAIAGTMKTHGHNVSGGSPHAKGAVIAFTYLLVATYSFTWAPISWCYPPELFPVRLRGKAVSLATSANWAFGFANSYYSPPGYEHLQWRIFLLFGSFNVAAGLQAFFFFPETKGLSLEDVDELFASGIKAWETGDLSFSRYNQTGNDRLAGLVVSAQQGKLHEEEMVAV